MRKKSASGRALLTYNYDLNGNLIHQKDVTGKVTEYTYNALDLIEKVTDNGIIIAEYSYYPDGTTRSLKNGNLYTEYSFDVDKNLTSLKTHLGTEVLTDNHYTYDRNGNRTEKRQLNGSTHYTYDARNQLTKVQYPTYTEELYYDKTGNRTRRTAKGIEELYKYDPRNRLTEYTKGGVTTQFTYDNAGNLLRDDKAKYTYDAFNRTEKVETFDGHVQINRYDAEGLRHELEEDGKLVQFIFRGDEIVGEEKDSNIIRYIRGYDLVASDAESARTYYHYASDEMGSITHVVEEDQVQNHYEYDVWGNAATCEETIENRFRFNGQQYDPITQQYYLRARFYNPVIGRFTQEDTYRGDGLNLYAYCANNPVYYVDPSGNVPKCVKEAYKKIKNENPEISEQEAWKRAYEETGKSVDPRDMAGTVTGGENLSDVSKMMRGTQGNIGVIPKEIANRLRGKEFKNFNEFRKEFWKTVASSKYANEFNKGNIGRMKKGYAPRVSKTQQYGKLKSYTLHHKTPIHVGGGVYNLDNIVIVTPLMHENILSPEYHRGHRN